MLKIFNKKEKTFDRENLFLGSHPILQNSEIIFNGHNNILVCDKNVKLIDSRLCFQGNNSLIYLKGGEYKLSVDIYHHSVLYAGENNFFNQALSIILSEGKNVFLGDNNNFSLNIWMRNSDAHLIYDITSKKRLNFSKSIYIGDNIWIGQDTFILKGTHICSGSIIGAQSVVANKAISAHSLWCGNPAKEIKSNVCWSRSCVHKWQKEDTLKNKEYDKRKISFSKRFLYDQDFIQIEKTLETLTSAYDKYLFLKEI